MALPIPLFVAGNPAEITRAINQLVNDINALVVGGSVPYAGQFTVATLPAASSGTMAFAIDGRKIGEGAASGTGVFVYFSQASWRVMSTDAPVLA